MFKSITEANIEIKTIEYSLKQTYNKRNLVYENELWVNTKAYNVTTGAVIK